MGKYEDSLKGIVANYLIVLAIIWTQDSYPKYNVFFFSLFIVVISGIVSVGASFLFNISSMFIEKYLSLPIEPNIKGKTLGTLMIVFFYWISIIISLSGKYLYIKI